MHFSGIPSAMYEQIKTAMKRPEGSVVFQMPMFSSLVKATGDLLIFEVPVYPIYFRLERDQDANLRFYQSAPGTGTRVATINLAEFKDVENAGIGVRWSPDEIGLFVSETGTPSLQRQAKGEPSQRQFRVGSNGEIFQLGDASTRVMGARVFLDGKEVLRPTAIQVWDETLEAIDILQKGSSPDGFLYENVCSNMSVAMLVTGYESYCKQRFVELEEEGIVPDFDALFAAFSSVAERNKGLKDDILGEASSLDVSPVRLMIDRRRIDSQDFDKNKRAYNKGYGISFGGGLGLSNSVFEAMKNTMEYRHRIIHVDPMVTMFNQARVPPEEPVFSNRAFVTRVRSVFDSFIQALHSGCLTVG